MSTNQSPHLNSPTVSYLKSGGSLRDGWNYLIPQKSLYSNTATVIFLDDNIQEHIKEQIEALKNLYIDSSDKSCLIIPDDFNNSSNKIKIDLNKTEKEDSTNDSNKRKFQIELRRSTSNLEDVEDTSLISVSTGNKKSNKYTTFVVKRGFQVVGFASLNESENTLENVVIRRSESYNNHVGEALIYALRYHRDSKIKEESAIKDDYIVVESMCEQSKIIFAKLGYSHVKEES